MAASVPSLAPYNVNPSPQGGTGPYGAVPAPIDLPPSQYQQASTVLPGLPQLTAQAGGVVQSQLQGQLSPDVLNQIKNQSAVWGQNSGMPGSGLGNNLSLASLGLTSLGEQQSGLQNYQNLLTGLGSQLLNPSLESDIASRNANLAAAPDPAAAALTMQDLLNPGSDAFGPKPMDGTYLAGGFFMPGQVPN